MDRDAVLKLAIARCDILYLGPILDAWYFLPVVSVTYVRLKSEKQCLCDVCFIIQF